MDQSTLSRSAAILVSAAVSELYPEIALCGSCETSFGFLSHFYFPHPLSEETLFQIEEKMRQIVREKRPIQTLEMVPFSARELLLKEGHRFRARELEGKEGLVHVAKIGSFSDLVEGPLLKNTMELGACKILSLEPRGKKELSVFGVARQSKAELKDFLKRWNTYPDTRHEVIGEKKGFWKATEEGILWLPPGLKIRQKLLGFFKQHLFADALEIERPSQETFLEGKIGEVIFERSPYDPETGLLRGGKQTLLQVSGENATSLLQTIGKTLNMLGFNLRSSGIDFLVEDGLGRSWEVATLEKRGIATVPVERNLALLIERDLCKGMIFEN